MYDPHILIFVPSSLLTKSLYPFDYSVNLENIDVITDTCQATFICQLAKEKNPIAAVALCFRPCFEPCGLLQQEWDPTKRRLGVVHELEGGTIQVKKV